MTLAPKEVVLASIAAYNAKDIDSLIALYQPDGRYWDPIHQGVAGRKAIGKAIAAMFAAVPDEQLAVETLVGDDGSAVAELRSMGTLAATGVPFELELTEVYEVIGGQIASCRAYFDPQQLLRENLVAVAAHLTRDNPVPGTDTKGRTA